MKIGAIAGLVAGIIAGIMGTISTIILFNLDLRYTERFGVLAPPPTVPVSNIIVVETALCIIWGSILGVIYSKAYDVIPGEGISKGLAYGLFIYLIYNIRSATYGLVYWDVIGVTSWIIHGILPWVAYGLVLGILYEFLCCKYYPSRKRPKIIGYDMGSGIFPGAVAGFMGGTIASVAMIGSPLILLTRPIAGPLTFTITFWMGQIGSHILVNMIWGTFFGAIFPKVYNLVPSKGIMKGLIYGLTVFLITSLHTSAYNLVYWLFTWIWPLFSNFVTWFFVGGVQAITFGLVLGLLYKKPTKEPSAKKEKTKLIKVVSCHHCGASIAKGSEFCNKCGKKQ